MASTNSGADLPSGPDADTDSAIELTTRDLLDGEQTGREGREQTVIPRADGGKDAWLFLLGCFMIESLVRG
jgi:hypothetical protein